MESRRPQRVADLLLHEIAAILQKDVKDPRLRLVTLTRVVVSPDLRVARVYYSFLGGEADREQVPRGLKSAGSFIRREVGHRLRLRNVPELRFFYDEALEKGFRVQEILEDIGHEPEDPDR